MFYTCTSSLMACTFYIKMTILCFFIMYNYVAHTHEVWWDSCFHGFLHESLVISLKDDVRFYCDGVQREHGD